jgi:NUMOD4 motif/HNH endonuclease
MTVEVWKSVVGYKGRYEVSSMGRVRSLDRLSSIGRIVKGRMMVLPISHAGYPRVQLTDHGKPDTQIVSRLVAKAFIPNPENKPCVNHIDGRPLNNSVDNLEWATYQENTRHAVDTGLLPPNIGVKNGQSKLTPEMVCQAKEMAQSGMLHREIARQMRVSRTCITSAVNGINWKYLND